MSKVGLRGVESKKLAKEVDFQKIRLLDNFNFENIGRSRSLEDFKMGIFA